MLLSFCGKKTIFKNTEVKFKLDKDAHKTTSRRIKNKDDPHLSVSQITLQ